MPAINHTHKYIYSELGGERIERDENGKKKLVKSGGCPIFRCVLEGCTHYKLRGATLNSKSICWKCGNEMTMLSYNLNEKKPHHRECRRKIFS